MASVLVRLVIVWPTRPVVRAEPVVILDGKDFLTRFHRPLVHNAAIAVWTRLAGLRIAAVMLRANGSLSVRRDGDALACSVAAVASAMAARTSSAFC